MKKYFCVLAISMLSFSMTDLEKQEVDLVVGRMIEEVALASCIASTKWQDRTITFNESKIAVENIINQIEDRVRQIVLSNEAVKPGLARILASKSINGDVAAASAILKRSSSEEDLADNLNQVLEIMSPRKNPDNINFCSELENQKVVKIDTWYHALSRAENQESLSHARGSAYGMVR